MRIQRRNSRRLLKNATKEIEKNLNRNPSEIDILKGAWDWLNKMEPTIHNTATQEQNGISWEQLFLGRAAYSWREELRNGNSGRELAQIMELLTNFARNMWNSRYKNLHGEDTEEGT